jgi:hypothetical protein
VPGGHEFTSFILGLYNAAGPGQTIDEDTLKEIENIKKQTDMKVLVSLSCAMCPDLVIACQRIGIDAVADFRHLYAGPCSVLVRIAVPHITVEIGPSVIRLDIDGVSACRKRAYRTYHNGSHNKSQTENKAKEFVLLFYHSDVPPYF